MILWGNPGVGKTTIMLKIASHLSNQGYRVAYNTCEQSFFKIARELERITDGNHNILICKYSDVDELIGRMDAIRPDFLVHDSIQDLGETPRQVTAAVKRLCSFSEAHLMNLFLICQVRKDGTFEGMARNVHIPDISLHFVAGKTYNYIQFTNNREGPIHLSPKYVLDKHGPQFFWGAADETEIIRGSTTLPPPSTDDLQFSAESFREWMDEVGFTGMLLAKQIGVSNKAITNYRQRQDTFIRLH